MNKLSIPIFFVTISMFLSGCATILGGRSNTLLIESSAPDSLQVYIDDKYVGTGPGKVKVSSRLIQQGSMLSLKMGNETVVEQILLRKPKTVYVVMDALLGGVPLGIDFSTGHIHRPVPRRIEYSPESMEE